MDAHVEWMHGWVRCDAWLDAVGLDSDEEVAKPALSGNMCELVWQGTVQARSFPAFRFQVCVYDTCGDYVYHGMCVCCGRAGAVRLAFWFLPLEVAFYSLFKCMRDFVLPSPAALPHSSMTMRIPQPRSPLTPPNPAPVSSLLPPQNLFFYPSVLSSSPSPGPSLPSCTFVVRTTVHVHLLSTPSTTPSHTTNAVLQRKLITPDLKYFPTAVLP